MSQSEINLFFHTYFAHLVEDFKTLTQGNRKATMEAAEPVYKLACSLWKKFL